MNIEIEKNEIEYTIGPIILTEIKDEHCEENFQDQPLNELKSVLSKENFEENENILLSEK